MLQRPPFRRALVLAGCGLLLLVGRGASAQMQSARMPQWLDGLSADSTLALGRALRAVGEPDSALYAFRQYTLLPGGHAGLGQLEMARTLLTEGAIIGEQAYYAGAASDDPVTVAGYRSDIQFIFMPGDSAGFDAATGAARAAWLVQFWTRRGTAGLTGPAARMVEHYRRLAYVRQNFGLSEPRRYNGWEKVKTGSTEFDDRGIIYLRHGPPSHIADSDRGPTVLANNSLMDQRQMESETDLARLIEINRRIAAGESRAALMSNPQSRYTQKNNAATLRVVGSVPPNLTWQYIRPDGNLTFTFVTCARLTSGRGAFLESTPCAGTRDYHLVESLLDAFHANPDMAVLAGQLSLGQGADTTSARSPYFWSILDRAGMSLVFFRLATANPANAVAVAAEARDSGRRDIKAGLATETYGQTFPKALKGRLDLVSVGSTDTLPLVHVLFAVQNKTLTSTKRKDLQYLTLSIRATFMDAKGDPVAALDTAVVYRTGGQLDKKGIVLGRVALPVPPNASAFRASVAELAEEGPAAGMITAINPLSVPEVDGKAFALSDLVIGSRDIPLNWAVTPFDTVWFNPTASFSRETPVEIYYEMYGATPEAEYRVDIGAKRQKGGAATSVGGKEEIKVSYTQRALDSVERVSRTLDLNELKPGVYDITVKVTAPSGEAVSRSYQLDIRPPEIP